MPLKKKCRENSSSSAFFLLDCFISVKSGSDVMPSSMQGVRRLDGSLPATRCLLTCNTCSAVSADCVVT